MLLHRRGFVGALAGVTLAGESIAQSPPRLAFTAIPDQDETRLVERFARVSAYLAGALGVQVVYVPVKSYPAAVTAFTNNQVQLAWFGGVTGLQARRAVPGSQAIAQGVEDTHFQSFFIANARTGLAAGEDFPRAIAGRSFTFGSRSSTSGRLMPEYHIRRNLGAAPEQVFSRVGFSGDHSRTLQVVQSGAFEVGAVDFAVFDLDLKAGRFDPDIVRVIWKTPPFPNYNWTIRGDVDARFGTGFLERTRAALIAMHDRAILDPFGRSAFVPARNEDYRPIEEVALAVGVLS